eukprot:CAMPEP_0176499766 /NCGR_PEP_ID=MMETSP0200_2-20121128/13123_1 /TAXON_ID=947934 /ORGANISM="Chaetoceros sp., Strain GSL56" /LENGTH=628 /DNA_ID=CAMNT_0017898249 /DNA_START=142 /DNA_END=2025 /DNA_ORIENTATION=+
MEHFILTKKELLTKRTLSSSHNLFQIISIAWFLYYFHSWTSKRKNKALLHILLPPMYFIKYSHSLSKINRVTICIIIFISATNICLLLYFQKITVGIITTIPTSTSTQPDAHDPDETSNSTTTSGLDKEKTPDSLSTSSIDTKNVTDGFAVIQDTIIVSNSTTTRANVVNNPTNGDDSAAVAGDNDIQEEELSSSSSPLSIVDSQHFSNDAKNTTRDPPLLLLDDQDFNSTTSSATSMQLLHKDKTDAIISSKVDTLLQRHSNSDSDSGGPLKFYMYQHPNLTLADPSFWPYRYRKRAALRLCPDEIYFDESIFVVLGQSSHRTLDPYEADVFIIPIPMGRIFSARNSTELWDLSFSTLIQEPLYLQLHGHRHILIATGFPLFKNNILPLMKHYSIIENVTLVQSWDPNGVKRAITQYYYGDSGGANDDIFHEYKPYFKRFSPATRSSISVGLGTKPDPTIVPIPEHLKYPSVVNIPLNIPSMDTWRNASNFIFYHTRTGSSQWNSTIYRHVPVTNVTMSHLPPSSIGWGIVNVEQWLREFVDSKFCLVIRGDSPHSKAFVRSVRAGCIPVVIADCLPVYAPVFKSILNMSEYAILLEEKKFVEDPEGELLKLLDLKEDVIQSKIKHL